MKLKLKEEGLKEILEDLQKLGREGKTVQKQALGDTGKRVVKFLKGERTAGGFVPLGKISNIKGHKKPWGKMKFISINLKRGDTVIATTKGLNKKMEEGGTVKISERFKRFLHFKGIHLRKDTVNVRIPARPLFKRTWYKYNSQIVDYFKERLVYRINRCLRKLEFKRSSKGGN